jgi:rRNA maturation RNase YbeY
MAKGFQSSRRHQQRSAAVPSRSSSATPKRSLPGSNAPSQAVALRLGTAALRHGGSNRRRSGIQDHPIPTPQRTLSLHNRQRVRPVNLRLMRRIVSALLRETCPHGPFDLAIYLVAEPEMTRLNETFLRHKGSTDVITFDYAEEPMQASGLPRSGSTAARGASFSHLNGGRRISPSPEPGSKDGRDAFHRVPNFRQVRGRCGTRPYHPEEIPGEGHPTACLLHGEIFVCVDEAISQARRFHTTWQSELVRYIVHGVLHLLGYDDAHSRARRKMKAAEDSLVGQLAREFDTRGLNDKVSRTC